MNWKPDIHGLSKNVSRGIGVLSKIRFYVNRNILHQLYYSIIYPFLTYGLSIWGNMYRELFKRELYVGFSKPDEHFEPPFKELQILKFTDLVTLHNSIFKYHSNVIFIYLPLIFFSSSSICTLVQYRDFF